MLEMFVVRETVFFLTGVMIGIGAIARLITGISLKKLVRAASNMSKSNHPLMRLVRAKFEHGCMVSDKVQNLSLIHISEPTRLGMISYAVFCLKKKKKKKQN